MRGYLTSSLNWAQSAIGWCAKQVANLSRSQVRPKIPYLMLLALAYFTETVDAQDVLPWGFQILCGEFSCYIDSCFWFTKTSFLDLFPATIWPYFPGGPGATLNLPPLRVRDIFSYAPLFNGSHCDVLLSGMSLAPQNNTCHWGPHLIKGPCVNAYTDFPNAHNNHTINLVRCLTQSLTQCDNWTLQHTLMLTGLIIVPIVTGSIVTACCVYKKWMRAKQNDEEQPLVNSDEEPKRNRISCCTKKSR